MLIKYPAALFRPPGNQSRSPCFVQKEWRTERPSPHDSTSTAGRRTQSFQNQLRGKTAGSEKQKELLPSHRRGNGGGPSFCSDSCPEQVHGPRPRKALSLSWGKGHQNSEKDIWSGPAQRSPLSVLAKHFGDKEENLNGQYQKLFIDF